MKAIAIDGETKSAAAWAADPRCRVGYQTLLNRWNRGVEGFALLVRNTEAGRPRSSGPERLQMARDLDRRGETLAEMNRELGRMGHRRLSRAEWAGLHDDWRLSPEDEEALRGLTSAWLRRQVARERGLPLSRCVGNTK